MLGWRCCRLATIAHLGRQIYGPLTGLGAAGLGLITPGFLFLSSSFFSHTATLFWITSGLVSPFLSAPISQSAATLRHWVGFDLGYDLYYPPLRCHCPEFTNRHLPSLRDDPAGVALDDLTLADNQRLADLCPIAAFWWKLGGSPTFNPYLEVWPYDRVGFGSDIGPQGYSLNTALFVSIPLKWQAMSTGLFGWPLWTTSYFFRSHF